jgi:hypothetical protein
MLRVCLLKISAPDFTAGNLRGNSKYRNTAAMTIVEPVDQMQIAWAATSRANGQVPREMRFRAGRKRCRLLVSHMDPLNLRVCANRVRDAIERISANAVNLPDSCFGKNIHQQVCYVFPGHDDILSNGIQDDLTFVRWRGLSLDPSFLSISSESSAMAA